MLFENVIVASKFITLLFFFLKLNLCFFLQFIQRVILYLKQVILLSKSFPLFGYRFKLWGQLSDLICELTGLGSKLFDNLVFLIGEFLNIELVFFVIIFESLLIVLNSIVFIL